MREKTKKERNTFQVLNAIYARARVRARKRMSPAVLELATNLRPHRADVVGKVWDVDQGSKKPATDSHSKRFPFWGRPPQSSHFDFVFSMVSIRWIS